MKKFFKMLSVYLATVFILCSVAGCSYATPPTIVPPQLDVPAVMIDAEGVATWDKVDNAIYYVYVIDEGAEILTDVGYVQLDHNDSIKVKAVSGSEQYNDSEFSIYKTYIKKPTEDEDPPDGNDKEDPPKGEDPPAKTKLATPTVTIDDNGVAAWNSIANASYYVYVINNGGENRTEECIVRLADNDSIKVKAASDSELYTDSDFSQAKIYVDGSTPTIVTKLATPTVTIDSNGLATWNSITNANSYAYVINNGSEQKTASRSVQLQNNNSIKVKAVSDSELYTDSDFSQVKTYTKPVDDDPIQEVPLSAEVKAYYSGITATQGDRLLGQVHDLITTTHTYYTSYGECSESSYVNVTDPGPNGGALEFYTQKSIMSFGGSLGTWNREHVWCKSLSNGMWKSVSNSTRNGGSDMHHIRPTESGLNSSRSSYKFGEVNGGNPVYYRDSNKNNLYVGGYVGGGAFEPLDQVKGDVARIVLYVYTHYNTYANVHGTTNGSKSGVFGTLNFTHIMAPTTESTAIQLLIQWCKSDPVDEIEITRNNEVYKIQGNRNPFIDHPEYVTAIWG